MENQSISIENIFENRLLIFLEDDSGVFNQVLLDQKTFKKISALASTPHVCKKDHGLREGIEPVTIRIGEREIPADVFNGMQSFETDQEIKRLKYEEDWGCDTDE